MVLEQCLSGNSSKLPVKDQMCPPHTEIVTHNGMELGHVTLEKYDEGRVFVCGVIKRPQRTHLPPKGTGKDHTQHLGGIGTLPYLGLQDCEHELLLQRSRMGAHNLPCLQFQDI